MHDLTVCVQYIPEMVLMVELFPTLANVVFIIIILTVSLLLTVLFSSSHFEDPMFFIC